MKTRQKFKIKDHLLTRASVITIFITSIFVFAYVLVIAYTYNNLFTTGSNNLLSSTESSSVTFSKIVANNMSQMNYISSEFVEHYNEDKDDKSEIEHLKSFISGTYSSGCKALTFVKPDGTYYASSGDSGTVDMDRFKKNIESSEIFVVNDKKLVSSDYAQFHETIVVDGEVKGYHHKHIKK